MKELYYLTVDENLDDTTISRLLHFLPFEKRLSIQRYHFKIDKTLILYSALLVEYLACSMLNIKNDEIEFIKGEYGKPHIKGYPSFQFNVSHTRNAIAVAVSSMPIGVDIERVRTADERIAKRYFTKLEQEYIYGNDSKSDLRFYEIWTKKEAYVKYKGKGLLIPLNSFNTLSETIADKIDTLTKDTYCISVCSDIVEKELNLVELTQMELIENVTKSFI